MHIKCLKNVLFCTASADKRKSTDFIPGNKFGMQKLSVVEYVVSTQDNNTKARELLTASTYSLIWLHCFCCHSVPKAFNLTCSRHTLAGLLLLSCAVYYNTCGQILTQFTTFAHCSCLIHWGTIDCSLLEKPKPIYPVMLKHKFKSIIFSERILSAIGHIFHYAYMYRPITRYYIDFVLDNR